MKFSVVMRKLMLEAGIPLAQIEKAIIDGKARHAGLDPEVDEVFEAQMRVMIPFFERGKSEALDRLESSLEADNASRVTKN